MKLRELNAAATPGPWNYFYKHKYDEHHVSVPVAGEAVMKRALFPDGCPTDLPAIDAELIAYLRNHAADFIELITAAQAVTWFDWSDNDRDSVACIENLRNMLKPFAEES